MSELTKINNEIRKINLMYKYKEGCCISFIVTDNSEIREYIKRAISSIDTSTILDEEIVNYDFYLNRNNGLDIYNKLCRKKSNLIVVTGIQDYAEYLTKSGTISSPEHFYMR